MVWIWRRRLEAALVLVLLALVAVPFLLVWRRVPVGATLDEARLMYFHSVWTSSTSPDGCIVHHVLNDAGAAHSGRHRTWILHYDGPLSRPRVVVSGWSGMEDASEAIRWTGPQSFSIELSESRREHAWRRFDCSLDSKPITR